MFSDMFEFAPKQYEDFRSNRALFFASLNDMSADAERYKALSGVKSFVDFQQSGKVKVDFVACIHIAFDRLNADFRNGETLRKIMNDHPSPFPRLIVCTQNAQTDSVFHLV